jgi:hypothetical protein
LIASQQEPEVRAWLERKREKDAREGRPKLPAMGLRYLECEAAMAFGMGLREFLREPGYWRAAMIAHVVLKGDREAYVEEVLTQWVKNKNRKAAAGEDPFERQRKQWGVG